MHKPHLLLKGVSPPLRLPHLPRLPRLPRHPPTTPQFHQQQLRTVHITRELTSRRIPVNPPPADPAPTPVGAAVAQQAHTPPSRYSTNTFFGTSTFTIHRGSHRYKPHTQYSSACDNPAHQLPTVSRAYMPKLREGDFSLEKASVLAGNRPQDHRIDIPELSYASLRHDVAFKLGVEYLSPAMGRFAQRRRERLLDGYVHGMARPRILVAAPVLKVGEKEGAVPRWVFFVVDSVTPWTFLSKQAMQKLDIPYTDGVSAAVTISGYQHPIHGSPPGSGFEDLSILGTDFMRRHNVYQTIDWKSRCANVYIGRGGAPHFSEVRMSGLAPSRDDDMEPAYMYFNALGQEDEGEVTGQEEGEGEEEVGEGGEAWKDRWKRRWMGTEWGGVRLFGEEGEAGGEGEGKGEGEVRAQGEVGAEGGARRE